eukprot:6086258-Pyramimonas_sp.AAC.2
MGVCSCDESAKPAAEEPPACPQCYCGRSPPPSCPRSECYSSPAAQCSPAANATNDPDISREYGRRTFAGLADLAIVGPTDATLSADRAKEEGYRLAPYKP